MACCADGVHRPTVAGIHSGHEGAYSISLSGGYEDDVDLGDCFTYTGEGGRALKGTDGTKNLRTAPQSKDQTLTRGNLALSLNAATKRPVRVIRGYKLCNKYAPEYGYRYDGKHTLNFVLIDSFHWVNLYFIFMQDCTRWKSSGLARGNRDSASTSLPSSGVPINHLHLGHLISWLQSNNRLIPIPFLMTLTTKRNQFNRLSSRSSSLIRKNDITLLFLNYY